MPASHLFAHCRTNRPYRYSTSGERMRAPALQTGPRQRPSTLSVWSWESAARSYPSVATPMRENVMPAW